MQESTFRFKIISNWRNIDKKIFFCFLTLFFLGLFFSFSSTSSLAGERLNKDYYFYFSRHLIFTFFAITIMMAISIIETSLFNKIIIPLFIIFFILLFMVPFVGIEVKGAKRWLDFYFFRLQPIELLKPFFILVTVKVLNLSQLKNIQMKYFLSFLLLSSVIVLLVDQPDLGQSILLVGGWIATVFVSGVSFSLHSYLFF